MSRHVFNRVVGIAIFLAAMSFAEASVFGAWTFVNPIFNTNVSKNASQISCSGGGDGTDTSLYMEVWIGTTKVGTGGGAKIGTGWYGTVTPINGNPWTTGTATIKVFKANDEVRDRDFPMCASQQLSLITCGGYDRDESLTDCRIWTNGSSRTVFVVEKVSTCVWPVRRHMGKSPGIHH